MHTKLFYILITYFVGLLSTSTLCAQRVSFGLYATDEIALTKLNSGNLDFNELQYIILAGQSVTINLSNAATAALTIVGRADMDVTVTFDAPATLNLDTCTIPLSLSYAYSNTNKASELDAKAASTLVPSGFTSVTFPMSRRANGAPSAPPVPDHAGYVAPTTTAHLFIYGTLGVVPAGTAAGVYSGNINVRVEYTKN